MDVMSWTPLLIAMVPIVMLWMNQRATRQTAIDLAKEAKATRDEATAGRLEAEKAVHAAETAANLAATTDKKVDAVGEQLDGRLTAFFAKIEQQRVELADAYRRERESIFERGREVGRDEAATGPLAESQARLEADTAEMKETLAEQNRKAAEAQVPVAATADVKAATAETLGAAKKADDLAKKS